MTYQHIEIERRDRIATVTFNRPDRANALNYEHLAEIEDAALAFRDDAETRAVIFTGAGKHFSSGADLTDPGDAYRGPLSLRRRRSRIGTGSHRGGGRPAGDRHEPAPEWRPR